MADKIFAVQDSIYNTANIKGKRYTQIPQGTCRSTTGITRVTILEPVGYTQHSKINTCATNINLFYMLTLECC